MNKLCNCLVVLTSIFFVLMFLAFAGFVAYVTHIKAMWEWEAGLHMHASAQWFIGMCLFFGFVYIAYKLICFIIEYAKEVFRG